MYLGMYTRYLVTLEDGSELTIVQQNLERKDQQTLVPHGTAVIATWHISSNCPLSE
jgi:hypothetical protein